MIDMEHIYADLTASISELKKSPTALLNRSDGRPIALLNHNKPTAYLITAELYEQILESLEDHELLGIARMRLKDKKNAIKVDINAL